MKFLAFLTLLAFAAVATPSAYACMCNGCYDIPTGEALETEKQRLRADADYVVAGFVTSAAYNVDAPSPNADIRIGDDALVTHWMKFRLLPLDYEKGRDLGGIDIWLPVGTSCDKGVLPSQYVTLLVTRIDGRLQTQISFCDCVSKIFFPHLATLDTASGMAASLTTIALIVIGIIVFAWKRFLGRRRKFIANTPPA